MIRLTTTLPVLACLALLFGTFTAGSAAAGMGLHPGAPATTLVEVAAEGTPNTTVRTEGRVVFRNAAMAAARIVFASKDARSFDCEADGEAVVQSRKTQYLLRAGAELSCTVRPGRYHYTTLTQNGRAIHKARPTLRVQSLRVQ